MSERSKKLRQRASDLLAEYNAQKIVVGVSSSHLADLRRMRWDAIVEAAQLERDERLERWNA